MNEGAEHHSRELMEQWQNHIEVNTEIIRDVVEAMAKKKFIPSGTHTLDVQRVEEIVMETLEAKTRNARIEVNEELRSEITKGAEKALEMYGEL